MEKEYHIFSFSPQLPHALSQPVQQPEHFAPSGQPMHLTPRFFDLQIYPAAKATMAVTRTMMRISIAHLFSYALLSAYAAECARAFLRAIYTITAMIAITMPPPAAAVPTWSAAGSVKSVPIV